MELFEAMKKRASFRRFKDELTSDYEIKIVLEAAYLAPHLAFHDMRLHVITNPELLAEAQMNGERFNQQNNPMYMYKAPVWILVSAIEREEGMPNTPYTADMIKGNLYWTLGSLIQNMQLAATSIGLGSCAMNTTVVALRDNPELARKLGVPEGHMPIGSMVLGYTDIPMKERAVKKELFPTTFIK